MFIHGFLTLLGRRHHISGQFFTDKEVFGHSAQLFTFLIFQLVDFLRQKL